MNYVRYAIVAFLFLTACKDCNLLTLDFYGTVQDVNGNPIAGAEVVVGSVGRTSCGISTPMARQSLITDTDGHFYKEIEIYQDDYFSWNVNLDGYKPSRAFSSEGLLPGNFEILFPDGVEIILRTASDEGN